MTPQNEGSPLEDAPASVGEHERDPVDSRWPTVIGIIGIIYALGGMLCNLALALWAVLLESLLANMAGMQIEMPMVLKLVTTVLAFLTFLAGLMLLFGSIGTLRRRRSGPKLLMQWVIVRMLLLVIGLGSQVVLARSQVEMQRDIAEEGNRIAREHDPNAEIPPVPSDQELMRNHIVGVIIFTAPVCIFPLFVGLYLSRAKIREQVAAWE